MYILLTDDFRVTEIIPDKDPAFLGIPIEQRYTADFIARLICVPDSTAVEQNWIYDPDAESFSPPPELELPMEPLPEPVAAPAPSEADDMAALLVDHEYRLTLLELGLADEGGEE